MNHRKYRDESGDPCFLIGDGHGQHGISIRWDPAEHDTKESAARALYRALRDPCIAMGMDPDVELILRTPDECGSWWILWESGPAYWSVAVFAMGSWGFCETEYGFDLIFTD